MKIDPKRLFKPEQLVVLTTALTLSLGAMPGATAADGKPANEPEVNKQTTKQVKIKKPLIPVSRDVTLDNGLRLVISEDRSVPVASVVLIYDVGSRDEVKGKSGFAHLFEHMMFEGSENVAKGEYFKYIQAAGGLLNASTHSDFTDYFEKLPSNKIEMAFWLESDRMKSLKVNEKNFKNQLDTVKEEKRLRIDNQPYMPAALEAEELIFDNWANAHPTIGYFEDLESSSVKDVQKFFDTYYCPNNCVIAVVGDVDSDKIEKQVRKYFGPIARRPDPPKPNVEEPRQTAPKHLKKTDKHAKMPAFWLAWKAPARRDKDSFAINLIQAIMTSGPSSRLYQRMVKEDQVALKVNSSYEERRGPSEYDVMVVYKPENSADKVKKIVLDELEKLKKDGVLDTELQKAKNTILRTLFSSDSYYSLQRSLGRAEMLAQYTSFYGDPSLIDQDVQAYLNVTSEDIKRVANELFRPEGITVVDVIPESEDEGKAKKKASSEEKVESANKGDTGESL